MPDSLAVTVSDAITAGLNAQSFSYSFIAVRAYYIPRDRADLPNLFVGVVPFTITRTRETRGGKHVYEATIGVTVQAPVDPEDSDTIDPLVYLMEEINDYLQNNSFSSMWLVGSIESNINANFTQLKDDRYFIGTLEATFRIIRS